MLGRSAASLDVLSDGRVELGIGAGAFWDAIEAMGGPRRTPGEAVQALEEAIAVIRAVWRPGRTPRIDGEHYRLAGAKPGPLPVHPIGIWVGAYRPADARADRPARRRLAAQPGLRAARAAPRDERAHRRGGAGRRPGAGRGAAPLQPGRAASATGSGFLQGTVDDWVEQLAGLALEQGTSGFVLATDAGSARAMQRFAEEVAPAVRIAVEHERSAAAPHPAPAPPAPTQPEERASTP